MVETIKKSWNSEGLKSSIKCSPFVNSKGPAVAAHCFTVGPNGKNLPEIRLKNCEIDKSHLFWQVLIVKFILLQATEMLKTA